MIHATIDGDTLAPKFEENRYERVRQVHHPEMRRTHMILRSTIIRERI